MSTLSSRDKPAKTFDVVTCELEMLDNYEITRAETFLPNVYKLTVTDLLPRGNTKTRFFQLILGLHCYKKGIPNMVGILQGKIVN